MKEIVVLILKLLEYFDVAMGEVKKRKRQRDINKIQKDPESAWNEKFSQPKKGEDK